MRRGSPCVLAALFSSLLATGAFAQGKDFRPVTQDMLQNPDPADWLMISRTYDEQRFGSLDR